MGKKIMDNFPKILFLEQKVKSNSIKSGISVLLISFLSPKRKDLKTHKKKFSTDFKIKKLNLKKRSKKKVRN